MRRLILVCITFMNFSLSYASGYIEKYTKYFKGIGTVKLIMLKERNGSEKHKLILEKEEGKEEVIWEATFIPEKHSKIKQINLYEYSQILDIFINRKKCSFLISTREDIIEYIALSKEGENWNIKMDAFIIEISDYMRLGKIEKIKLINFNLILTKDMSGKETIYKVETGGKIKKYVEQNYENRMIVIFDEKIHKNMPNKLPHSPKQLHNR